MRATTVPRAGPCAVGAQAAHMHSDTKAESVREAIEIVREDVRRLFSGNHVRDLPSYASKMERSFAVRNIREAKDHAATVIALLRVYSPAKAAEGAVADLWSRVNEINSSELPYDGRGDPTL